MTGGAVSAWQPRTAPPPQTGRTYVLRPSPARRQISVRCSDVAAPPVRRSGSAKLGRWVACVRCMCNPEIRLARIANQFCGTAFLVRKGALGCSCGDIDVRGNRVRRRRTLLCAPYAEPHLGTYLSAALLQWAGALDVVYTSRRGPAMSCCCLSVENKRTFLPEPACNYM